MFLTDVLSHSNAGYLDEQGKFQTFFKDGVLCHFVASMFSGLVFPTNLDIGVMKGVETSGKNIPRNAIKLIMLLNFL